MSARLVPELLERSAARLPNKTALVSGRDRWSYAELDALANQCAHGLIAQGVRRGDRVAIAIPNGGEAVIALFGALKAGATFVMIHPGTKPQKLRYILADCAATVLVTHARAPYADLLGTTGDAVPTLKAIVLAGPAPADATAQPGIMRWAKLLEGQPQSRPARQTIDLDLACLIYTSGSTGEPKGVMSDHSNMVFAAGSIVEYVGNIESDVVINVLPLSFDYGLYQVLMTFLFGGTLVLEGSFVFPAAVLKVMEREGVTGFPGVPTVFAMLLGMDLSGFDLSKLRYLTNTAAALPEQHILEIRKKFPQATLFSMYGLTETKRTLYLPPAELDRRPGSVGIPIPGTEAWLVNEVGERLPPGSTGELVVRGRHVMRGYWRLPKETAERYRPGASPGERLCFTGDLFRTDSEGFFYFVARRDEVIKSKGEKVAPKEVEGVIYQVPGVAEAVVIGRPDPVLGQAIKALVVPRPGVTLTREEVLAHCRRNLDEWMVPQQVEFREQLPKNASGKIDRRELSQEP